MVFPVLGSIKDGTKEALLDGELGVLVDPNDMEQVTDGILNILNKKKYVNKKLNYFNFTNYELRVHELLALISIND